MEPGAIDEERLLGELISEYFSSWSKPDMPAFQKCFHPRAAVYFIDTSSNLHSFQLDNFIDGERKAHLLSAEPLVEKPTRSSITVSGRLAHARVGWELHQGSTIITGTDYFTFIKTDQGWKIVSLVYEQDKK
ncbi:MAG: nuclear transport factor 2 family protein [Thermodesulfobacteriota bacterium]